MRREWRSVPTFDGAWIVDIIDEGRRNYVVARVLDPSDADLIVKAVAEHDALLAVELAAREVVLAHLLQGYDGDRNAVSIKHGRLREALLHYSGRNRRVFGGAPP